MSWRNVLTRQCNHRQCCDVRPNTHVRIRVCVIPLPKLEGRICSTVLHAPAIIDSVVTSDLIRMCVFGSALYHCHNWRERFVPLCRMLRPCRVIRTDYVMYAQFLLMDVVILFPKQTRVYMLLSEGLLILGICGQT